MPVWHVPEVHTNPLEQWLVVVHWFPVVPLHDCVVACGVPPTHPEGELPVCVLVC